MNSSVQLIFVILLSIAIANGNAGHLHFWYTGQDLNCSFYSERSNERPFAIYVRPLWQNVRNEYCESKDGNVVKIDKNEENDTECNQPDFRIFEMEMDLKTNYFFLELIEFRMKFRINSCKYHQIPVIRELIDFKGDFKCLDSKQKYEVLECYEPFTNCKNNKWIYNTTTMNKTALMVSL